MESRTSTIGVLLVVASVLVAALVPGGFDDCPMCSLGERSLLGVGIVGASVGTWLALDGRRWTQRVLPSVAAAVVAVAVVYAVRLAL